MCFSLFKNSGSRAITELATKKCADAVILNKKDLSWQKANTNN